MGRGSSKIGGGSGSGGSVQQPNNNPLVQSFVNALNDPSGRWTQEQRADLLAVIRTTTEVGDSFVWQGDAGQTITITKTGRDTWDDHEVGSPAMNGAALRDVLLILYSGGNGKFSFRSK